MDYKVEIPHNLTNNDDSLLSVEISPAAFLKRIGNYLSSHLVMQRLLSWSHNRIFQELSLPACITDESPTSMKSNW